MTKNLVIAFCNLNQIFWYGSPTTFVTKYLPNYLVGITKLFVKFTNAFLQCRHAFGRQASYTAYNPTSLT